MRCARVLEPTPLMATISPLRPPSDAPPPRAAPPIDRAPTATRPIPARRSTAAVLGVVAIVAVTVLLALVAVLVFVERSRAPQDAAPGDTVARAVSVTPAATEPTTAPTRAIVTPKVVVAPAPVSARTARPRSDAAVPRGNVRLSGVIGSEPFWNQGELVAVVKAQLDEPKACYAEAIADGATFAGFVDLIVSIDASGKTTDVMCDVRGDHEPDALVFCTCVTAKASAWKFPPATASSAS